MKLFILQLVTWLAVFSASGAEALAGPVKVHVAPFVVTGMANRDELKSALQGLLASRVASDRVLSVDSPDGADVLIAASYVSLGKIFSIDASLRSAKGEPLGRYYVQGEGQDDLIPAIGRLAQQLQQILPKVSVVGSEEGSAGRAVPPVVPVPVGAVVAPPADIIRAEQAAVKPALVQTRIEGALIGVAPGRELENDQREFVVAGQQVVQLFRRDKELIKTAEYTLSGEAKILGIDTADLDSDGALEIYVTIMEGDTLSSRVLSVGEKGFAVVADRLPYYFRAIALEGKKRRVYAQEIGKGDEDFYGDMREVAKKGAAYTVGAATRLPKFANVFSYNRFAAADGRIYQVMLDEDGYLRVVDGAGEVIWKSGDRYGGSETYFKRDEQQMQPLSDDRYRWRFLGQRVVVTDAGQVIVPRNSGLFVIGNNRSYTKNTVFAYKWTGVALDEQWRTKESQNYLADYYYDSQRKELVMLEVVKKEGLFDKGASTITVKKVE